MSNILSEEEMGALLLLTQNHRVMTTIVPDDVEAEFVARLTTWINFVLDTRMLPPLAIPIIEKGDGIVCPYCGVPASQNVDLHVVTCEWRQAVTRWAIAQVQIEEDFPPQPRPRTHTGHKDGTRRTTRIS